MSDAGLAPKGADKFKKTPPSAADVAFLLAQGDTITPNSPLHRLGTGAGDAAAGNHNHNSVNSAPLFSSATDIITGDLSTAAGVATAVRQIAKLLARLGATNNTSN